MVNLGPVALFSNFKLTTYSKKHLENISLAHILSLMYKLLSSSRVSGDLPIGYDRDRGKRKEEITNNKNIKDKYHVRIMPREVFGFAENQEKTTYGLGYNLTLTRNKDEAVLDKAVGIADARIKTDHIHWYVQPYTASIQRQGILSKQFLSRTPTELRHIERSVFMKEANNQNLWNFQLGSQESMNIPIWIIIGFQQKDRQDSQIFYDDTICRLPVTSAQCLIGTEKYPDNSILFNYDDDDDDDDEYGHGYDQIKEVFRASTKDDILQSYTSSDKFRSSNVTADDVGYNLYVFDIPYQQNLTGSQPIKIVFKIDGIVPNHVSGFALVLKNEISICDK